MNNIFIINKKVIKYRERVRRILKKLQEIELQTKQSKYEFEKFRIEILERIINKKEIRSSLEYLRIIRE